MYNFQFKKRGIFFGIIFHGGLLLFAFSLGYNTYKEIMQEIVPLTRAVKDSIKNTFPMGILIFLGLYIIFSVKEHGVRIFLSFRHYVIAFILNLIFINIFFYSKGRDIIVPFNFAVVYFIALIVVCYNYEKFLPRITSSIVQRFLQDWIPPIIYRWGSALLPRLQDNPSFLFITASIFMFVLCAMLLVLKAEKIAMKTADIAYFSLMIAVGIEIYRHMEQDADKKKKD